MKSKKVVIVTGPAASGKNEVCKVLRDRGFYIIDADTLGHKVLSDNASKIRRIFGPWVVKRGRVDRRALGELVFGSAKLLKLLNSFSHPKIQKAIKNKIKMSRRKKIAVNAALFKELRLSGIADTVISVISDERSRMFRLVKKRNVSPDKAKGILRAQLPARYYKSIADIVIVNDSSVSDLRRKAKEAISCV